MSRLSDWWYGIKRCPYCKKVCKNSSQEGVVCSDCLAPAFWFFPDWPSKTIEVFDVGIQMNVTKQVMLTPGQYIQKLKADRDKAVADFGKADRATVEARADAEKANREWRDASTKSIDFRQEIKQQRDADKKLIDSLEKAIAENSESIRERDEKILAHEQKIRDMEKHDREVRTPLLEEQRKALAGAKLDFEQTLADRDLIGGECKLLNAKLHKLEEELKVSENNRQVRKDQLLEAQKTIARLARGDFTPEELQNLCHNLDESKYHAFVIGCAEYQRKVFGKCDRDDLKAKLELEQSYSARLANAVDEAARIIAFERNRRLNERTKPCGTNVTMEVDGKQITNLLGLANAGGKMVDQMNSNKE